MELITEGVKVQDLEPWMYPVPGELYKDQGRLSEAEDMYVPALQGYKKSLGPVTFNTHLPVLKCLGNVGHLYREQGKLDQARQYYLLAEEGSRTALGSDSDKVKMISKKLVEMGF